MRRLPKPARAPAVRRGTAAHRRAHPHIPTEDPTVPGCCATCRLPLGKNPYASEFHVDQLPPVDPDITAAEARRLGEHD